MFEAITTPAGLTAWWTETAGSGETSGQLRLQFGPPEPLVIHTEQATRPTLVRWSVVECAFLPDWVGTHPTFTITATDEHHCRLHFRHHGLTEELECIDLCTQGWNHFLDSLRLYTETGYGMPRGSAADQARRAGS